MLAFQLHRFRSLYAGEDTLQENSLFNSSNFVEEDWSSFSVEMKVDVVMIELLRLPLNLSHYQAYTNWENTKQKFISLLDKLTSRELEAAFNYSLSKPQRQQLKTALAIKKSLIAGDIQSYAEIKAKASALLQQKKIPFFIEELRLYQLRELLNHWVDWNRAKLELLDSLQVLKAVMAYYEQPFPASFFDSVFDLSRFPHVRYLHEAALLWNKLKKDDMFTDLQVDAVLSTKILEDNFLYDLAADFHRQVLLDKLFARDVSSDAKQTIYFNGLAFKNAQGKSFDDLIHCPELEKIPEYKGLSLAQRRVLLENKFFQIAESTHYTIGSLFHSLESISIRIFFYQNSKFPPQIQINTEKKLLDFFKALEESWELGSRYAHEKFWPSCPQN